MPGDSALPGPRAELLKRAFEMDALTCPWCGETPKLIALITDGAVVRRILEHLGLPTTAPVLAPARSPPELEFAGQVRLDRTQGTDLNEPEGAAVDHGPIPASRAARRAPNSARRAFSPLPNEEQDEVREQTLRVDHVPHDYTAGENSVGSSWGITSCASAEAASTAPGSVSTTF